MTVTDLRTPRRSLHDAVTERLRDLVVEGELEPGARVNERLVCATLAISRTPLREAMKVLAAEGLLELLPNRGAIVARLSAEELDQTIEVMAALERLAAKLVVERLTPARLAEIKALHFEMRAHHARAELSAYFKCNQAIHLAIMAATGNCVLERQYAQLNARIRRYRYMANLSQQRWDQSIEEHEAILTHLVARDPVRLADTLARHLMNKLSQVKDQLSSGAEPGMPIQRAEA